MDAWAVLGVPETATEEEIRAAHRREILECHPDRAPANARGQFEERAKRINAARDELLYRRQRPARSSRPASSPSRPSAATYTAATTDPPPSSAAAARERQAPTQKPTPAPKTSHVTARHSGGQYLAASIFLALKWAVILYFLVLAFAILGWLLTEVLPAILAVLE